MRRVGQTRDGGFRLHLFKPISAESGQVQAKIQRAIYALAGRCQERLHAGSFVGVSDATWILQRNLQWNLRRQLAGETYLGGIGSALVGTRRFQEHRQSAEAWLGEECG